MPALSDPRYESFAQAIVAGKTGKEAVVLAGFDAGTPASQHSRSTKLRKNPQIKARIEQLNALKQNVIELGVDLEAPNLGLSPDNIQDLRTADARIRKMEIRYQKLEKLVHERAVEFAMREDIPGGSTGYVIEIKKQVGREVVISYETDTALLKAMADLEKAIAQALGQHIERREEILSARDIMKMPVWQECLKILADEWTAQQNAIEIQAEELKQLEAGPLEAPEEEPEPPKDDPDIVS